MIVFWCIGQPCQRTEMTILNFLPGLELKDFPFIFVRLALPFTLPNNRTTLAPIRNDICAKHILLNRVWIHQGVPHFNIGSVNIDLSMGYEILVHLQFLSCCEYTCVPMSFSHH